MSAISSIRSLLRWRLGSTSIAMRLPIAPGFHVAQADREVLATNLTDLWDHVWIRLAAPDYIEEARDEAAHATDVNDVAAACCAHLTPHYGSRDLQRRRSPATLVLP